MSCACLQIKRHFMKRYFFIFFLIIVSIVTTARSVLQSKSGTKFIILVTRNVATHQCAINLNSSQDDNIIGSWSLVMHAFDNNNNGKLDDEERKKGNAGKHFYQFNADGTCLIHTMKLKGWYELKPVDSKKRLFTYAEDEGKRIPENEWYFISVSKTELIILSRDKFTFWI